MSLEEELDRLSIKEGDGGQGTGSSSSNHYSSPQPQSGPSPSPSPEMSQLPASPPPHQEEPPEQPQQPQDSPEEEVTNTTTTTPTTVKRQPSSSSLFESESHLFDFIDDHEHDHEVYPGDGDKSWPTPPSSIFLLCNPKSRPTSEQSNGTDHGRYSHASYNFLDEPSLEESESLSGHEKELGIERIDCDVEKTFEDYFRQSPVGQGEVESSKGNPKGDGPGQPPSEKSLQPAKACKMETSPSLRPSSGKGRAPPPPGQPIEDYSHEACPTCAHPTSGVPGQPGDYPRSIRSASWCDPAHCQFSIPYPHKNHFHVCPQFTLYNYGAHPHARVKFFQGGYNTNLKRMPENWQRMKARYHARGGEKIKRDYGAHYYHYGYEHGLHGHDNWLSYALTPFPRTETMWRMRYSVPSSGRQRKQFMVGHHLMRGYGSSMKDWDYSLCMCCVCCNCAKTNQTNCCCCYHCVHTVSSCRRSDILRMVPVPITAAPGTGAIVSILKKKPVAPTDKPEQPAHVHEVRIVPPPGFEDKEGEEGRVNGHDVIQEVIQEEEGVSRDMEAVEVIEQDVLLPEGLRTTSPIEVETPSPMSGPTPTTEPTELGE